jgi:sterol desaturase/sphingolipid hydroxylase (fatty acid hydroxylase superfamily)
MTAALVVTIAIPHLYVLLWWAEARAPARRFVAVPSWGRTGVLFFITTSVVATITPIVWSHTGLTTVRLLDLRHLGFWALPAGLLTTSFVTYWWHRAAHRYDFLWRATHQLHHSAERVDVPGAFFSHPLEVVVKTSIALVVGEVVLGLSPGVAATSTGVLSLVSVFQHWNGHTPRWLGWWIPRPEMHVLHHEAGIHARNYGDLAIWDVLFGTHVNPTQLFVGRVGLAEGASARVLDMLTMRDVSDASSPTSTR